MVKKINHQQYNPLLATFFPPPTTCQSNPSGPRPGHFRGPPAASDLRLRAIGGTLAAGVAGREKAMKRDGKWW